MKGFLCVSGDVLRIIYNLIISFYSQDRLSNSSCPAYSHILILLLFLVYMALGAVKGKHVFVIPILVDDVVIN